MIDKNIIVLMLNTSKLYNDFCIISHLLQRKFKLNRVSLMSVSLLIRIGKVWCVSHLFAQDRFLKQDFLFHFWSDTETYV